jgi:molybdenum cofactor biosynthesis enzyme MoaA
MYITGIEDKVKMKELKINTVVVSLLGDIDLTQVAKLTNQMDIPGGEHLNQVKKN